MYIICLSVIMKKSSLKEIIKRDGSVVKYDRSRIATAILKAITATTGRLNRTLANSTAIKVEQALIKTYSSGTTPSVEDIQDIVESVLMENRFSGIARNYIIYRHNRAMTRAAKTCSFQITDNVPYKKIYEVLRWNLDHQCDTVSSLNKLIARGKFPELVRESDARYTEETDLAANFIAANVKNIRVVIVAGPSSSGKTTTTIKIAQRLKHFGIGIKTINVDNYFYDLDEHPVDQFGDRNYETPEALDLGLINSHLVKLLEGKTIKTPHYDFKTGIRHLNIHELRLLKKEILLIDSLHGLHENMTRSIPDESKFRVYIETLGQFKTEAGTFMRWADNRLLRRMIRDKHHRNLKPMETLTHWHYVRRSEFANIIPFVNKSNVIINSALPYELPILKHRLFRYIAASIHRYENDPYRLDAHIRANRVYELLKPIKVVSNTSCLPRDSLLREFVGGSKYKY